MNKIYLKAIVLIFIIISGCTTLENLESKKEELTTKRSVAVAKRYIEFCATNDRSLLTVDLSELSTELSDNTELQDLRAKVDTSIVNIRNYLMSVDKYRNLMETAGQNGMRSRELARAQKSITDSLTEVGSEYSEMRQTSLDLIKENNLRIITLIVEDYEKRGEEIPLTWIPGTF